MKSGSVDVNESIATDFSRNRISSLVDSTKLESTVHTTEDQRIVERKKLWSGKHQMGFNLEKFWVKNNTEQ